MNTLPLLERMIAPARAGELTQQAGADAIAPAAIHLRHRILNYIRACGPGGATIEEIARVTGLKICTVCGRVGELKTLNLIRDSGMRRAAASGVAVKVWIA